MAFTKRGDNQQIQLVDPDELSPEQKEVIEKVVEQEENLERQEKSENKPS